MRTEWMEDGDCRSVGGEAFFPDDESRNYEQVKAVKAICRGCPVRQECFAYAMEDPRLFGIWAGTTKGERTKARRTARRKAVAA